MATKKKEDSVKQSETVEVVVTKAPSGTVKMTHPDGRVAYVYESMIPAYQSGGFKEEQ